MDLSLKNRKRIKNGFLPTFVPGGENIDTKKLTNWDKFKTRWNDGGGEKAMNTVIQGLDAA